jgi:hypothetical protein
MSTEPLAPYAEYLLREQVRGLEQMLAICRAALVASVAAAPSAPQTPVEAPGEAAAEAAAEALATTMAESVLAVTADAEAEAAAEAEALSVEMAESVLTEPVVQPVEPVVQPVEPAAPTELTADAPTDPPEEPWTTATPRRIRVPPKVIGSPINKSQRPMYELSDILNGERALATRTAKNKLTAQDIEQAEQLIIKRDATEFRGFYHKRSHTLFRSPTAACVTLLTRHGVSKTWQGGAHIWLERGGQWVKLMNILQNA